MFICLALFFLSSGGWGWRTWRWQSDNESGNWSIVEW